MRLRLLSEDGLASWPEESGEPVVPVSRFSFDIMGYTSDDLEFLNVADAHWDELPGFGGRVEELLVTDGPSGDDPFAEVSDVYSGGLAWAIVEVVGSVSRFVWLNRYDSFSHPAEVAVAKGRLGGVFVGWVNMVDEVALGIIGHMFSLPVESL